MHRQLTKCSRAEAPHPNAFCPPLSIIVPTVNEAANLPLLVERIHTALSRLRLTYEVLIIDEGSSDGTPEVCAKLAEGFPVTLFVRESPIGGLSGAVLHGFARACGEIVVVMDADLQHPPEALPSLIAPLTRGESDFVIGSRRAPGGSIVGPWGTCRRLNSAMARWLAAPLVRGVHDPMSGFFAVRRATVQAAGDLNPLGYKIGLELLCKCDLDRVVEVPIQFGTRLSGDSKLTFAQQIAYLRHLSRLYLNRITFKKSARPLPQIISTSRCPR
jgi:dolichol-phosphate mannosyltransferase